MSELLRKAVEKARILRARPHLKPVAAGGGELSKAERWRTAQMAQDWLNANADPKYHRRRLPDMEENGQFKLLTRGRLGMRLKEFRYYQPPGGFYGNPYDKDFVQERQRERRNGLIKAGIVGAGLLGGGALLGRGLYKVGKSGAVRRAEDLAEELTNLRATKAPAEVAPAPRGRPPKIQSNTPPPAPPQTPTPTPPPQAPPAAPPEGKAPKTKVVKDLNQSGDLPTADAAAEVEEITAATSEAGKAPRKLTAKQQKLAKRQAKVAKFAAAQSGGTPSVSSTPAPAAPAAVVPKSAPVAAKTPAAPKPQTQKPQTLPTKPVASATNEEFWESGGKKIPLTGTAAERAALRGELDKVSASDGFKGQTAGDVIDAARARATASLKNDFPPDLSATLRAAGKENNPKPKAKRKSKESKAKKEADDADDLDEDDLDDITEGGASPEEADWEAKLKENPQVRTKKTSAKAAAKAPAAKKPAASGGKKAKKEAAPLSLADKIAAKVKAKRDKKKNLSALLSRVRYFNQFQTDEGGIPLTGRVARDRFVKKLRDEDLDRRDANILRAGGAGALAGLLARGRIGASKRALIGAGAGGLGVIGIRALTNNDRDIYGERDRGSKRAELLPAVGGLGAAAWLAGKRLKAFAKKFNHGGHGEHGGVKELGRGFYSAKLLPSERWIKRSDPRGWVQNEVLPAPDKHSAYSKYVADKMRAIRRLNSGNIPYTQRAQKPVEWLPGAQAQLPSYYFSSRLRGVKEFGSSSYLRLVRKLNNHLARVDDHILTSKLPNSLGQPSVRMDSPKPSYGDWWAKENYLLNKLSYKSRHGKMRQAEALPARIAERSIHERAAWAREAAKQAMSGRAPLRSGKDLSCRLRGLKHFDDHRLYYFKGRNTGIAAKSVEEARSKKKRGGDELVAVRTPSDSEKSQMARGVWVRTRRDGKSPQKSRYGKGRGQGPARKSLSAKLRRLKEFAMQAWDSPENVALRQEAQRKRNAQIPRHLRARGWSWSGHWDGTKGGGSIYRDQDGKSHYIGKDGFTGFSARLPAIKFFEKREKRGMNPYVGAALSGFGSGAALGSLALLRRGATFRSAAKTAAKLGVASAGIVGGGALLGSKIVGDPRKEESAPFMKRAAIGGTLVGAGAGLGGALLLRRTSGGARALVAASKKSEPFSRPAMWLRKAPLAGAAGIGAVGGALYGGGMGLDEGQQVDSIRNLRKDMKNLSAKLRLFGRGDQARWDARRGGGVGANEDSQFANTSWGWATDRPMYVPKRDGSGRVLRDKNGDAERVKWDPSSGQLWNSIAREAKNKRVTVQRGGRLTRDAAAVLQGKERERDASGRIKKREWEKSWFHNKATEIGMTAAGLGGLATVRYANNNPETKVGQAWTNTQKSVRATGDGLSEIGKNILGGITKITAKKAFSARLKRLRELDAIAEYEGWDIRDPRGKSARVFAPGSRRRERRQKEWHEKTDNERKLWKAGIAAGVLGGAGAMLVGQRLVSGKSLIPSRFLKKKPIDPSKFADTPPSAKEADEILKRFNK